MRSGELASDRRCYREIGGAACRCGGFRDSGEIALVVAGRSRPGLGIPTTALLVVLFVVMGLGLLYAYRAQTPSITPVVYSQAVTEINAGQVRKVTVTGGRATLELQDGDKQQLNLPERPETFQKVLNDYNAANPSRQIVIDYQQESQGFQVVSSILLSLLPILLIGAFLLYVFRRSVSR
jgi:ATP-dependent Zn protease